MVIDKLIKSEYSDDFYCTWTDYREKLTSYILNSIESYNIREYLRKNCKRRMDSTYRERDILKKEKKTLAIWGAGESNDMDLSVLSKYFKLILIDRDASAMERAGNRYNLKDDCISVDLLFWDIDLDNYKMFEALLIDRAPVGKIIKFLESITEDMILPDYRRLPKFDYSVAIGLASQLNSRFAGLLKIYQDEGKTFYSSSEISIMYNQLQRMNEMAVRRFFNAMDDLTRELMLIGYESQVILEEDVCHNEEPLDISIAGSRELHVMLENKLENRELQEFVKEFITWNFTDYKKYVMYVRGISR